LNFWNGKWKNVGCDWAARAVCKRSNTLADLCDVDNGWFFYSGMCYKYSTNKVNWFDAQAQCEVKKGRLAVVDTLEKWSNIQDIVTCKDYEAGIWIGLSDTSPAREFWWTSGEVLGEDANWDVGQPLKLADPGNNCVKSLPLAHFKWRVDICDRLSEYLCEKPIGSCPDGWQDMGTNYCYQVVGENELHWKTYSDAEQYCMNTGSNGHLMIIQSPAEQDALKSLLQMTNGISQIRIGLSDFLDDNVLVWANGLEVVYDVPGTRDFVDRRWDCGFVYPSDVDARWNLNYCFDKHAFICQIPIFESPVIPADPAGWVCPVGWDVDQANGTCYEFSEVQLSYSLAKQQCVIHGGKMLVVAGPEQQSFISPRIKGPTWLGLEYLGSGLYQWHDGTVLKFENWSPPPQGPNSGPDARCTSLKDGPFGQWKDDDCNLQLFFVCQRPATFTGSATPGTPTVPWHTECGPGWSFDYYGQQCYKLVRNEVKWEEAEAACVADGSHLVSLHNPREQNYINALVMQNPGWVSFWIGGNDIDQTRGWKWTDGSPFYFWNWNIGEPNNLGGSEFCIEMSADMYGRWNDINCDRVFSYICSKPTLTATPPPGVDPTYPPAICNDPQPLVSGHHYVRDAAITASSFMIGRPPSMSRFLEMSIGSWAAADGDTGPWVGVQFTHYVIVSGITTWGAGNAPEWVIDYAVSSKLQSGSFYEYYRTSGGQNPYVCRQYGSIVNKNQLAGLRIRCHPGSFYPDTPGQCTVSGVDEI